MEKDGWGHSVGIGNPGGQNGTGGLIILYGNIIKNNSIISSNGIGTYASDGTTAGASGGGSINLFYRASDNNSVGTIEADGGSNEARFGRGGRGR